MSQFISSFIDQREKPLPFFNYHRRCEIKRLSSTCFLWANTHYPSLDAAKAAIDNTFKKFPSTVR